MKLRFEVDQAEAFRRGVDCPKSIVTVDVNPAELDDETRELIADRLEGIDVCSLRVTECGLLDKAGRIKAMLPTFESLMEAVKGNETLIAPDRAQSPEEVQNRLQKALAKRKENEKAITAACELASQNATRSAALKCSP